MILKRIHLQLFRQRRKLFFYPDASFLSTKTGGDLDLGDLMIMSPTLWPEPNASAAGVRTTSLLNHFTDKSFQPSSSSSHSLIFNNVHYACGLGQGQGQGQQKQNIPKDVTIHHLPPNRSEEIKNILNSSVFNKTLQTVMFDRYYAEEIYSFHFYKTKPNVLRVLDMQDFHSLRKHREYIVQIDTDNQQKLLKKKDSLNNSYCGSEEDEEAQLFQLSHSLMDKVMNSHPMITSMHTSNDDKTGTNMTIQNTILSSQKHPNSILLRELASIHRSDLTLVCSPYELDLLQNEYGIPKHKLSLASFFINVDEIEDKYFTTALNASSNDNCDYSFESRKDFITLGGLKHPPNIDQVKVLKYDIWPKIKQRLPQANLHIYGAYTPHSLKKLHDEKLGFFIQGHASSLGDVLSRCRVMLAPLRFGAGIKGKIIDSWRYGCPVVTTPIGSEGMTIPNMDFIDTKEEQEAQWGGMIASKSDDFVQGAIDLYKNKSQWIQSQMNGRRLIHDLFDSKRNLTRLNDDIYLAIMDREKNRQRDYFSACLWSQQSRSTEYFSKWIEQKESNVQKKQ